nr:hypothetical protein [Tanacetum cinerariifolium]
ELRAVSGHVLGAAGVQIPENNLDNLQSSTKEDGTLETMDPQDLLGLGGLLSRAMGFLRGTSVVVVILVKGHAFPTIVNVLPVGYDPLTLVDKFNPVEDNIDKQEKDKIGTKPDKNGKRGKARQCQSSVIVKKAEKEKKIQTKGTENENPKVV